MENWNRIFLVLFVLIGGTVSFAFWSLQQFDYALDSLSATSASSYVAISQLARKLPTTLETATSTATTSEAFSIASSTLSSDQDNLDPKFQLIFSPKKNNAYIGCTYEISWSASTTIRSLESTLIDSGTRKPASSVASKLPKNVNIEADSQSLMWKVGAVWPGEYFILISNVNGIAVEEKSYRFKINEMPTGSDEEAKKNICEKTGGDLL